MQPKAVAIVRVMSFILDSYSPQKLLRTYLITLEQSSFLEHRNMVKKYATLMDMKRVSADTVLDIFFNVFTMPASFQESIHILHPKIAQIPPQFDLRKIHHTLKILT